MEITRDLVVQGEPQALEALVEHMTEAARSPWARYPDGEARIPDSRYRVFMREGDDGFTTVAVALTLEGSTLKLVNITPKDQAQLSTRSYNAVLAEFSATLLAPAASAVGLGIVTSLPRTSIRAELGDAAADLLEQFSGAANMATGSSHPADFSRWARFLLAVHRSGKRLDGDLLTVTLVEQDWPPEKARELVEEHAFAERLLAAAEKG